MDSYNRAGKTGIIRALMARGYTRRPMERAVREVFEAMKRALARGELVEIPGGTLEARRERHRKSGFISTFDVVEQKRVRRIHDFRRKRILRFKPDPELVFDLLPEPGPFSLEPAAEPAPALPQRPHPRKPSQPKPPKQNARRSVAAAVAKPAPPPPPPSPEEETLSLIEQHLGRLPAMWELERLFAIADPADDQHSADRLLRRLRMIRAKGMRCSNFYELEAAVRAHYWL